MRDSSGRSIAVFPSIPADVELTSMSDSREPCFYNSYIVERDRLYFYFFELLSELRRQLQGFIICPVRDAYSLRPVHAECRHYSPRRPPRAHEEHARSPGIDAEVFLDRSQEPTHVCVVTGELAVVVLYRIDSAHKLRVGSDFVEVRDYALLVGDGDINPFYPEGPYGLGGIAYFFRAIYRTPHTHSRARARRKRCCASRATGCGSPGGRICRIFS